MLPPTDHSPAPGPIGIFDSGFGGFTVMHQIMSLMPQYDYVYLGDNARAPYGTRSYELVYEFTLQAVRKLFSMGCQLVILACNTASAKALRTIQQHDLPEMGAWRRVLGVVRPTAECIGQISLTRHVGVMATQGTIRSRTYELEIAKLFPDIQVTGEACPMWVPLVENGEYQSSGADYFVRKHVDSLLVRDPLIDSVILGCTHYPLLLDKIRQYMPERVRLLPQGEYVARSLQSYLARHDEMRELVSCGGNRCFYTTEQSDFFSERATMFMGEPVSAERIILE